MSKSLSVGHVQVRQLEDQEHVDESRSQLQYLQTGKGFLRIDKNKNKLFLLLAEKNV